jgi:hypothetical protein
MIAPTTYRLQVRDAVGNFRATVTRDSTFILGQQGLRASLTAEQTCQEMTLVARNGPRAGNGPGLGLNPLDLVTLEVSADGTTFTPVYYGQLRVGGNPNDYTGESMTFRGLDARLRTTPTLDGAYVSKDGGRQADDLILDTLKSGLLGRAYTLQTLAVTGQAATQIIKYDPAYLPNLGFAAPAIIATNHQPLGFFLDNIVTAGAAAGIKVRWGVRPDGYITMQVVNAAEVAWPSARATWKPPNAEVVYTAVNWAIEKRQDTGKIYYYLSKGPAVPTYGAEMKDVQLIGLNPWKPLVVTPTYTGTVSTTPASGDASLSVRDGDFTTSVTLTDPAVAVSAALTVPAGGAMRLFVDATSSSGQVAQVSIAYTSPVYTFQLRANDPTNNGFTKATYYADGFLSTYGGLPAGAVVTLKTLPPTAGGAATMTIREFRLELLDTATLDAAATAYYRTPEPEPGDLYLQGILLPTDLRGKIRTPRLSGPDYVGNVALWEYAFTTTEGVRTTAKIGDPDDPARVAQATLIKRLASQATAAAVQATNSL